MMSLTRSVRNSMLAVCCVGLLALSGCYDPYYVGGGGGYQEPWYDYDYYPSSGVYFNPGSGYYYHHDHGRWNHVRRLPRHIRIYDYDRVRLRLHGDRPYLYYDEHRRKYRGHRNKHKQKYRGDRYRDDRYRKERYKDERKHEKRYRRKYKDERKHDRHSGRSDKKRNKHERDRDDREYSSDRQRRNKKDKKKRQYKEKQRKLAEKQQEREYRRQAIDREVNAIQTRVYGGVNSDNSSRNSGWTIQ